MSFDRLAFLLNRLLPRRWRWGHSVGGGFFFGGFYRLLVVAADEGQAGTRHNEGQEQIADSCNVNRGVMRALASRNGNETVQSPV